MMSKRLSSLLAPAALAVSLGSLACSGSEAIQSTPPAGGRGSAPSAAVPVNTAIVAEKAMPLELNVIGSAEAFSTVAVRAQITGALTSVTFREGDDVRKGQVLFTLDRRPLERCSIRRARTCSATRRRLANAKSQAQRYQDLAARGDATKEQVDTTTTAAAGARGHASAPIVAAVD
jgi:multidrug efflux system membrane fusion protein